MLYIILHAGFLLF